MNALRLTLFFCLSGISLPVIAQGPSPSSFESLSQRAAAALSSDPSQSAELYRQALTLRPDWAEGWFYLGVNLYGLKRFGESKGALTRAGKLTPENGNVWAFKGLAEASMADDAAALADFRKGEGLGLADNGGFESTVRNRAAQLLLKNEDYSGVIAQLRPLAELNDKSAATINSMGLAALELPKLPEDKQGLVQTAGRAVLALYAHRETEAVPLFARLLSEYPNEPGVHYLNAISLLNHEPDRARAELERELALSPGRVDARLQLAILDVRAGQPEAAIRIAGEAMRLGGDNALAHLITGHALLDMNRYEDAIPEFQKASRMDPANAQAHLYLARAFKHVGQEEKARKEQIEFSRLKAAKSGPGADVSSMAMAP